MISNEVARIDLQWFAENDTTAAPAAAPPATTAPPPASLVEALPEDLRAYPKFAEFGTTDKLARSYMELEKKLGTSITPPGKNAKKEDWDRFYSNLGRPKTPEDYALATPEGFEADPASINRLKAAFHSAGMTDAQAKHVFDHFSGEAISTQRSQAESTAQAIAAGEAALRQEWGANYDNNVAIAARFVEETGGAGAVKRLEELGVANDPLVLKLLSKAGQTTSGKPLVRGSPAPGAKANPYAYMNEGKKKPD
jgi:hypothetical protein